MKVLLVEDSAVARMMLESVLTANGHQVTAVETGLDGWKSWQQVRHQIVISDWMMPELDGLELCRRIRAIATPAQVYFVLQTLRSDAVAEGKRVGVSEFLNKPVQPSILLQSVERAIASLGATAAQ